MSLSLTNTWGLWALLGLPIIVAIHFLQRRNRRVPATTLFLLDQMRRESRAGSRFERLRTSVPFWLQLLMVLLLTWLLVQPRWLRQDAVQRIALVMDASASMQAFRQPALTAAADTLGNLRTPGVRAELTLLSSDPESPSLYHGTESADLHQALDLWDPLLGTHDFTPALRTARGLVGQQGIILFITDHPFSEPPVPGIHVLSVGQKTENVGWTGVTLEEKDGQWIWHALVKNHGLSAQERQWHVTAGNVVAPPRVLKIEPGETLTLSGPFPAQDEGPITLHLTADALALDDQMPLVRPRPKSLTFCPQGAAKESLAEIFSQHAHLSLITVPEAADLVTSVMEPSTILPESRHGCFFQARAPDASPWLKGAIVAEPHPLMEGLNWQGLLARSQKAAERQGQDRVLLWQGERPLILLRQMPAGGRQLICQFDLDSSNARKLPAFTVLLHRFLESLRADKIAPEAANFDLRQRLAIAHDRRPEAVPLTFVQSRLGSTPLEREIPLAQAHLLRAPAWPGSFEVRQGEKTLLTGAAHFSDTREADLTLALPSDETQKIQATQIDTLHQADPNQRLWLLALIALLLGSWWYAQSKSEAREVAARA